MKIPHSSKELYYTLTILQLSIRDLRIKTSLFYARDPRFDIQIASVHDSWLVALIFRVVTEKIIRTKQVMRPWMPAWNRSWAREILLAVTLIRALWKGYQVTGKSQTWTPWRRLQSWEIQLNLWRELWFLLARTSITILISM